MTSHTSWTNDAIDQALIQMLSGAWVTQLLAAVARRGVSDQLASQQPQSSEELARAVGADADALHRVMRALSSLGVFADAGSGRYALTPIGERLRAGQPGSMRELFLAETDAVHRRSWDALVDAIRTGQPQPRAVFGTSAFEYYAEHPEDGQQFGLAMESVSALSARGILSSYDFTGSQLIVDLGGGNGSLVRSILRQHPRARGIVFDLPYMQSQAVASIERDGLHDRCRFEGGDFFRTVPSGGDIYILRFIIHDWNDAESVRILKAVRTAVAPGGRVLVVEMLVPEGNEPGFVQLMDINMLVLTGGRERTAAEYARLFSDAGLRVTRTITTKTPFSIVEGEAG